MGFDVLSYAIGLQAGKGNGGSSEKVLLAEQTFEGFALDSNYEAYIYSLVPAPYALTVGETYFVKWDGTVYECVAQDLSAMTAGMVAVGNLSPFGLSGNNEPFIINYVASSNGGGFLSFDTATSHTVKIYQKTSSSGGGSVEGVHFVTFMSEDGSTELYKRPVADGDDCADPVIRGLIAEPEKESTAQYNYTHVGWSANPNGALDGNILKAVTADKTVYANFAAVLRYYTVTYYDDDGTTVLKTESLAYGAIPSYVPTKDGYTFTGWTPEVESVTGNARYTAVWIAKIDFNSLTWAKIAEYAESGEAANVFEIGATKTFTTSGNVTVTAKIIGFNHDDLSNGNGKAGITLTMDTPFGNQYPNSSSDFSGAANTTNNNQASWDDSGTRKYWNSTSSNMMLNGILPAALVNVIKQVKKTYYDVPNKALETTDDYLWLISAPEIGFQTDTQDGQCYEYYSPNKTISTTYKELMMYNSGSAVSWRTRSKYISG